jgi:hypothetical protein
LFVIDQHFNIVAHTAADSQDRRGEYETLRADLLLRSGEGWLLLLMVNLIKKGE